ncbi:MAG TPA: glycine cleavage T C-terminal barrel domain-containing protein [Candidatus Binatia bacterium]|nr:glycine cleavage T C-terminal barrel domain-containing protein [Candidatus Binatia bacterium]
MPSPSDDYRALREDAAALDLGGWRVLRLSGADTREFLQGTATQDLDSAGPDRAAETLFLTEKGRPVAHAWVAVAASGADAWVLADAASAEALRPHLERFRIMEDVEFEGPAAVPRIVGVAGPNRSRLLASLAAQAPGATAIAGQPLSFLLLPDGAELPPCAAPEAAGAWRIAAGIPLAGADFDLDRIATELDLPGAISFTKGCYVGQEVVARTSNRGQVRRRRAGFRFSWPGSDPAKGTPILAEGAPAGFLTSAAQEPGTGEGLGMGYLSTEWLNAEGNPDAFLSDPSGPLRPIRIAPWPL